MSNRDSAQSGGGWAAAMGVQVAESSAERVELRLSVGPEHLQPAGIVHGGVYSGLIETACSIGAWEAAPDGAAVVGVENHSSFLRSVQRGPLRCVATPVHSGRKSPLWRAEVLDEQHRLIATGSVRLLILPPTSE